jgi:hypothetical protein
MSLKECGTAGFWLAMKIASTANQNNQETLKLFFAQVYVIIHFWLVNISEVTQ